MTPRRAPRRRRNAVLEAVEAVRRTAPGASLNDLLVFLYVCENEGLNMRELGQLTAMNDPMVSRTTRGLAREGSPGWLSPGLGWLEVRVNPQDRRGRVLHLTEEGARLRDALEDCIRAAQPIVDLVPAPTVSGSLVGHA